MWSLPTLQQILDPPSHSIVCIRDLIVSHIIAVFLTLLLQSMLCKIYTKLAPKEQQTAVRISYPQCKDNQDVLFELFHSLFSLKMILVAYPFMLKNESHRYLCFYAYILLTALIYALRFPKFHGIALRFGIWVPTYCFLVAANMSYLAFGIFRLDTGWEYYYSHFVPPLFLWWWMWRVGCNYLVHSPNLLPLLNGFWSFYLSITGGWFLIVLYSYYFEPTRTYDKPWLKYSHLFCGVVCYFGTVIAQTLMMLRAAYLQRKVANKNFLQKIK